MSSVSCGKVVLGGNGHYWGSLATLRTSRALRQILSYRERKQTPTQLLGSSSVPEKCSFLWARELQRARVPVAQAGKLLRWGLERPGRVTVIVSWLLDRQLLAGDTDHCLRTLTSSSAAVSQIGPPVERDA